MPSFFRQFHNSLPALFYTTYGIHFVRDILLFCFSRIVQIMSDLSFYDDIKLPEFFLFHDLSNFVEIVVAVAV